jgi:hypothetical protein
MDIPTGVDPYAAPDQFFEVILADEDFFEDAFASVMASWNASPPNATVRITHACSPIGHRTPSAQAAPVGYRCVRDVGGRAWRLRLARSPPSTVAMRGPRPGATY